MSVHGCGRGVTRKQAFISREHINMLFNLHHERRLVTLSKVARTSAQRARARQMATMLFYLSDVEEGGETVFLLEGESGLARKPSIDYKSCDVGFKVHPSLL